MPDLLIDLLVLGAVLLVFNYLLSYYLQRRGNRRIEEKLAPLAETYEGEVHPGTRRVNPRLTFSRRGTQFTVSVMGGGRGSNPQTWSRFPVELGDDFVLSARSQGMERKDKKEDAESLTAVTTGQQRFDALFTTLTTHPERAKRLLNRPVRQKLIELEETYEDGVVLQIESGQCQTAVLIFAEETATYEAVLQTALLLQEQLNDA
jgi:hypothetical protein